jgi:1,2-diacylglycerol 3-alpha-glucosyltransferase
MQQRLSLLFVTNNFTPYSGGVVSSLRFFAKALQKYGHTVTIVTLDFLNKPATEEFDVVRLYCPVRWTMHSNQMAFPWRARAQLATIIKEKKPSLVHVHHPFLLGPAARAAAHQHGIPVVFTYHSLYEQYLHYIPWIPSWLSKPWVQRVVKNFCTSVDGIIAPSSIIEDRLKEFEIIKPRAQIPTGLGDHFFSAPLALPKPTKEKVQLLSVSRFVKEKNIPFLLDVIAQLDPKKYSVQLIGYGPERAYLEEYAYVQKKIPRETLAFIEKPSPETLKKAYADADLFIFASQSETQGLVLAEAMSQGTPVIALHGPGQRDIIEQGKNGFLIYSSQEMVKQLEYLTNNRHAISLLQHHAFQTSQTYTTKKILEQLLTFYQGILDQKNKP